MWSCILIDCIRTLLVWCDVSIFCLVTVKPFRQLIGDLLWNSWRHSDQDSSPIPINGKNNSVCCCCCCNSRFIYQRSPTAHTHTHTQKTFKIVLFIQSPKAQTNLLELDRHTHTHMHERCALRRWLKPLPVSDCREATQPLVPRVSLPTAIFHAVGVIFLSFHRYL